MVLGYISAVTEMDRKDLNAECRLNIVFSIVCIGKKKIKKL